MTALAGLGGRRSPAGFVRLSVARSREPGETGRSPIRSTNSGGGEFLTRICVFHIVRAA